MTSILQYIPDSEHEAIRLGYSDYDCTLDFRRALTDYCRVDVPQGKYKVARIGSEGAILHTKSGAQVLGEGPGTILQLADSVNETNFWRVIGISDKDPTAIFQDITIADLVIDGNCTLPPGYDPAFEQNHGVFFYSYGTIKNITLRDVISRNCSGDGFCISTGTKNATLTRCHAEDNHRQGINITGLGGHQLITCRADGGGLHCEPAVLVNGLLVSGGTFSVISVCGHGPDAPLTNCKLTDVTAGGIIKGNYLDSLQISGGSAERIEFSRFSNIRISGCTLHPDIDHYGLYVCKVSGTGKGVILSDNIVILQPDSIRAGYYVNQVDGSIIKGNLSEGGRHGAIVQGGSDHIISGGNLFRGRDYGLVCSASERMPITGMLLVDGNGLFGSISDLRVVSEDWCSPTIGTNALAHTA